MASSGLSRRVRTIENLLNVHPNLTVLDLHGGGNLVDEVATEINLKKGWRRRPGENVKAWRRRVIDECVALGGSFLVFGDTLGAQDEPA